MVDVRGEIRTAPVGVPIQRPEVGSRFTPAARARPASFDVSLFLSSGLQTYDVTWKEEGV
jgi:hypothetical protein